MLDERGVHIPDYILGPYNEDSSINITCVSIGGNLWLCPPSGPNLHSFMHYTTFNFAQLTAVKEVKRSLQSPPINFNVIAN